MSLRCPYCHGELGPEPVRCGACATPVHAECAELHGRCVVLGCRGAAFAPLVAAGTTTLRYREPLSRRARVLLAAPVAGLTPFLLAAAGIAALGWICATST